LTKSSGILFWFNEITVEASEEENNNISQK